MKYSFYSHIHRYMRFRLSQFEAFVAKIDFRDKIQREKVDSEFKNLVMLLEGHGKHEDEVYHEMLRSKGSTTQVESEKEHHLQAKQINEMHAMVQKFMSSNEVDEQNKMGYEFYLKYTAFVADYLKHLIREETVLMPEFSRLFSEKEIREVTFTTYRKMSVDDMNGMLQVLFPYINAVEREVFLRDIKEGTSENFDGVWKFIAPKLELGERRALEKKFSIPGNDATEAHQENPKRLSFAGAMYKLYCENKRAALTAAVAATAVVGGLAYNVNRS